MTFMGVIRNPDQWSPPMTTQALVHVDVEAPRPLALSGEHIAAAVTAIAYVLLLPAATVLMSILTA